MTHSSSEELLIRQNRNVRRITLNRPEKLNAMKARMEDELAQKIAEVDPRLLATTKQAANAWFEAAGGRQAALGGAEYHAIYHQASEWGSKIPDPK